MLDDIGVEYEKLKAEYAEKYAERAAGAAMQLKTYEILISELERDCSGISGIRYDKVGASCNAYVDVVHDQAMRSSSSLKRWKAGAEEARAVVGEAAEAIGKVGDARYRQVLELRYLDGFGWKQVAAATGYSLSSVMHMKSSALACLHDCMPIQYRLPRHDAAPM